MSVSVSLGLDAARGVDVARYAIGGSVPRLAIRPASRDEVAEALRAASRDQLGVVPWGGGVAISHDPPPSRYDVALDLGALDRVIEYEPEDLTLTAECGATIASLEALLAPRGQELPIETPHAARATLGGTLAANASGARRMRFGAPRDRILGARFALGDGTLARTGGKVVKNVAGFGIHRMLCGSRGGLAVILEASLKLVAAPQSRAALIYSASAAEIADVPRWSFLARLEPAVVTVLGSDAVAALGGSAAAFTIVIGFEDDAARVEQQVEHARASLGAPVERRGGAGASALWQSLADLEERGGARLSFTTAALSPEAFAPLVDHPAAHGAVFHAAAGRLHLLRSAGSGSEIAAKLAGHGFTLIDSRGAGEVEPLIPPQSGVLALRRSIRAALDPDSTLALGERWERGQP